MAPKDDKPLDKNASPEVQQLQELYEVMLARGLDAVELKDEDLRVKLTRRFGGQVHPIRSTDKAAPSEAIAAASNLQAILTPLAGVFYRASSPTSAPFVKEGDTVDPGQT